MNLTTDTPTLKYHDEGATVEILTDAVGAVYFDEWNPDSVLVTIERGNERVAQVVMQLDELLETVLHFGRRGIEQINAEASIGR
jgi:hypothetical protein